MSLIGLLIILCFLFIAILGPIIRPDKSSKANQQHLELARKKPGFKCQVLEFPAEHEETFFSWWVFGKSHSEAFIPIHHYRLISQNEIEVEKYTGSRPNEGEIQVYTIENASQYIKEKRFLLGTDRYGRDLLSRLMAGTWISFSVGVISILISLLIGMSLGSIAGYYRGKVDEVVMWFINVVWSIPTLLLVIAITLALGKGFWQVFVAVGLTMWVEVARVVRGQIISIREKEFVEAGQSLGYTDFRVIFKHILPNVTGPVIVISAANFAAAILIEAGLSFLGLGAQPPQATWGKMISEHKGYIITGDAYLAIIPGVAIFLLVLSFVLVGNGLRDAFDTKGAKNLNL